MRALLIGNLRASLTVARSLARAGWTVDAGVDGLDPYLFWSNCVADTFRHPPLDAEPDAASAVILERLSAHPVDAVIPISEVAARVVAQRRAAFDAHALVVAPDAEIVRACADKAGLFAVCDALGVGLARRAIVPDHKALIAEAADIGFPIIVKPVDSTAYVFGEKAVIAQDAADLARRVPSWPEPHETVCVQRFVQGPRQNAYFAAHEGDVLGGVVVEIGRTDRADGTGYAVTGVARPPPP
ncbi:MAG: hypothetical protein ACFB2Z_01135, partial [Maricaulaceae bacterium]